MNIATVGDVKIDLEEPGYPGNDSAEVAAILPNQEIVKDPQVENTGDNAAIVYLKVDVPQETFTELGTDGTKGETKLQDLFALKNLSDNWELIKTETSTDADTAKTKTTYVYAYRKTLDKGAKTDKLFERVQMKNAVESDLSGKVEDIVIQACAIQATDIPDVDLAADENGYLKTGSLSDIYGIVTKTSGMFARCSRLTDLAPITNWQTGDGCSQLTDLTHLANWDIGSALNMSSMFYGCSQLTDASAINDWNIAKVRKTGFTQMFYCCPSHPTFTKRAGTWDSKGTFTPTT